MHLAFPIRSKPSYGNYIIMRVLLIKPPMVDGSSYYELPLNYAYLAAALLQTHSDIEVVDLQLNSWEHLTSRLHSGFEIVGTTTYSYSLAATRRICSLVRLKSPHSLILLGGPHASFAPQDTFQRFAEVDAIMRGESEDGFSRLCELIQDGRPLAECTDSIWNLATRDTLGHVGPRKPPALDLIQPAVKAFDLFDIANSLKRNPYMPILASRGCIYKCSFCLSPSAWGRMRIRSWENLRAELDAYENLQFQRINFLDDVFSLLRPLLPSLLPYLQLHKVRWGCETRLDDMDQTRIEQFCGAGMERIRISVETIHQGSLRQINKNARACDIRQRISLLNKLCPDVQVSFMIGIPGENADHIKATMDFADTLRPANCRFWAYSPLPGTPIFESPRQHGIVSILDHEQYDPHYSQIETITMTNEQINELLREAYQRFELTRTLSVAEGGSHTRSVGGNSAEARATAGSIKSRENS